jgi:serine/threonine-protein kinase
VDTGHILYLEQSSLWALPFNLDGLETTGGATQVIPSVPMSYWAGTPYMGIAGNGNLVVPALALLQTRNGQVSWVVHDGEAAPLGIPLADNPRITDDGAKVAVEVREVDDTRVWVYEIDRNSWTELTPSSSSTAPVWAADGRWIYYMAADTDGHEAVWRKSVDFTTPAERLWRPANHIPYPESVPADGRFLVYSAALGDQNDIWLLWLDGERRAVPLIETPEISEEGAQIHPSGRWIAYTSALADRDQVFVQELSEQGALGRRYPISRSGGSEPMWSHDGRFLYYRYGAQMICVEVTTEPEFRTSAPRVLMREFPGDSPVLRADYDIAPDGTFITAVPLVDWSAQRLDVVINWFAESGLRR